ncbi:hypothetical protein [Nocardioides coralli]|uniref:hypothetical protein n=1 Tax=Nocardioides coralli TaxID=2872154 RepID=UPI001CA3E25A|nr:hypothetical protein [Nocardioides coralli]QZY30079.1 hypothetical protein K6T13_05185 [Nocardioides coralli]
MRGTTTALFAAAAGCWTAGQAALPDMGTTTGARYDAVAASPTAEGAATALLLAAGMLLVLAALSGARRVEASGQGGRLLRVGTALVALGGVWLVAGRGAFNLLFLRLTAPEVPREVAVRVLDDAGGPAFVVLLLTLPCLLVGPVLLGIGLRRAGATGWLPVACWVAGIAVFLVTEFSLKLGEAAGVAVAGVGLVLLGRGLEALGGQPPVRASSKAAATSSSRRS